MESGDALYIMLFIFMFQHSRWVWSIYLQCVRHCHERDARSWPISEKCW